MAQDGDSALVETLRTWFEARREVLDAYLFGSRARGNAQPHSDVDIAVYVDAAAAPESPYGYAAGLTADLAAALGTDRVDVVILNDAPPLLYHRVLRDGFRLMTRDPRSTTTREGRALSRYCDYVPQLRKIDAALGRRIDEGRFGR